MALIEPVGLGLLSLLGLEPLTDLSAIPNPAHPANEVEAEKYHGEGDNESDREANKTRGDRILVEVRLRCRACRQLQHSTEYTHAGIRTSEDSESMIPANRSDSGSGLKTLEITSWKSSNGQASRCRSFGQKKNPLLGST